MHLIINVFEAWFFENRSYKTHVMKQKQKKKTKKRAEEESPQEQNRYASEQDRDELDKIREARLRNDELNRSLEEEKRDNLPGAYPPQEDIMNRQNLDRLGLDVDYFSQTLGQENYNLPDEPLITDAEAILEAPEPPEEPVEEEMEFPVAPSLQEEAPETSESDLTEEDYEALGPPDLSMDLSDDEHLKNRPWPVDMSASDLDVPGAELDDPSEAIGSEDEENNPYSLGGERHEDLEDPAPGEPTQP